MPSSDQAVIRRHCYSELEATVIARWIAAAGLALGLLVTAQAETIRLKLGSPVGPSDSATLRLQRIADDIRQRSDGRLDLEVVPIETIGFKNVDSLRVLQQGVLDSMFLLPYYLTRDLPMLGVFAPHGVMMQPEDNFKIIEVQRRIADELFAKAGVVPAAPMFLGDSNLRDLVVVSKRPVTSLDDLKRMKVRHFTRDGVAAFNRLGIPTQNLPSSELYLALKTGVVDAAVYGNVYIRSQSIYETTCCITYLHPTTAAYPATLAFSPAAWGKLDDKLKRVVQDAAKLEYDRSVAAWRDGKGELEAQQFLESKGVKFYPPLPLEQRKQIQAALLEEWRMQSEKLGPDAVRHYQQIHDALMK